jgi:hypothetical protein
MPPHPSTQRAAYTRLMQRWLPWLCLPPVLGLLGSSSPKFHPELAQEFACTAPGTHPAIAVVAGVGPSFVAGIELIDKLVVQLQDPANASAQQLLARCTVYVIAQPAPEASQWPGTDLATNATPTDDDHDGRVDEDGPEDLDGDGYITQLRVKDPAGQWWAHPLDPRVLTPVKPELNEQGEYSLYTEGIDNDGDHRFNEDGPGGVDFNKNWTWNYPENQLGAGPWPVSEPETRAVADFLYDHPEIAVVYTLGPQDNLAHPWEAANDGGNIKTGVLGGDAPVLKYISDQYKKNFETEGVPPGASGDGSFGYWAYFHYGRWSLLAQPWWVPTEKKEEAKPAEAPPSAEASVGAELAPPTEGSPEGGASSTPTDPATASVWDEKDERGQADIRKLKWLEEQGIDGFAPWTVIDHPDFPGQQVEVGGFRDAAIESRVPLDGLAEKHLAFLNEVAVLLPKLSLDNVKSTALGGGVWRIEARVVNTGFLPSFSEMGELSRQHQRLQATLALPSGATLLKGHPREGLPRLPGNGGSAELNWLVSGLKDGATLKLEVSAPAVGSASADIVLGGAK